MPGANLTTQDIVKDLCNIFLTLNIGKTNGCYKDNILS